MEVKNVLVVDDEDVVRLTTSLLLKKLGVAVTAMSNGKDAIAYFTDNKESVDLVILDSHMPEISGLELFQELKKIEPAVRAVISSGFLDDSEREEFEGIGIAGLLNKPFTVADLKNIIQQVESLS